MGIGLKCNGLGFESSYGGWHIIRCEIIQATIDYIIHKVEEDKKKYGHIKENDDENYIGKGSYDFLYKKLLDPLISTSEDKLLKTVVRLSKQLGSVDALIYMGVGGIIALCNKSDCEGFYSPGNSLDICMLFDNIKPFLEKYEDTYGCVYNSELYEMFETSYKTLTNVLIT